MSARFTDAYIRSRKPRQSRYDVREADGFSLRVFPSGERSFVFVYDFAGQRRRLTLGPYGSLSLKEARKLHAQARALLAQGKDPADEKSRTTSQLRADLTLRQLFDVYVSSADYEELREATRREYSRCIRKYILPKLGAIKLKELEPRMFSAVHETLRKKSGRVTANRTVAYTRAMLGFAVRKHHLPQNPCRNVISGKASQERPRERVLTVDEIRRFWFALDEIPIAPVIRHALRLLLVTAQRRGEIITARWEYIDFAGRTLSFPGDTTKSGHPHPIPLSRIALRELDELKRLEDGSGWIFPSPTRPGTHVRKDSVTRVLSAHRDAFGVDERFTVHDLRRTAATMLAKNGAHRDYISKILNHAESGVTALYDRYAAVEEQRTFLERWGDELATILEGADETARHDARPAVTAIAAARERLGNGR